jgi:acetyl-CoA carboxylase biotin carboxyl carrier protein
MADQPSWQDLLDLVAQLNESNFESAAVSYGNISVTLSNSDTFIGGAGRVEQAPAGRVEPQARIETAGFDTPAAQATQPAPAAQATQPANVGETIDAPMIGVFYRRPAPGADAFANPGDRVEADTTIGIIEIMKLMNPITAGKAGILGEFLAQDAQAVEFGTPLVVIDTNA